MTVRMTPRAEGVDGTAEESAAQAQDAGLPVTSTAPAPPAPGGGGMAAAPVEVPPFDGSFDALAMREPVPGQAQMIENRDSQLLEVLSTSPDPQLRDLADRLRGF